MVLITTVSGILLVFFLAVAVVPWLIRTLRDADTAPDGPEPFGVDTAWLAIRSVDVDRIMNVIGLSGVQLANWRTGLAITEDPEFSSRSVFVSPPVDGWTFVVGLALPHPVGDGYTDRCLPLLIALGREFNEVQYYYACPMLDLYAWSRFSDAKLRRFFAWGDEGVIWNKGALTTEERNLGLKVFDEGRDGNDQTLEIDDNERSYPNIHHVLEVARAWSVDPGTFGRLPEDPALGYVGNLSETWHVTREKAAAKIVEPPTIPQRPNLIPSI